MTSQAELKKINQLQGDKKNLANNEYSSSINRIISIWLSGIIILMPIKILPLPLNIEIVDLWFFGGLPVFLIFMVGRQKKYVSLSYLIPILLIFIGSLLSTFGSISPPRSIIVLIKELYLFGWFGVLTISLFNLNQNEINKVLRVWSLVVVFHGILMILQFLIPEIYRFTNSLVGLPVKELYRPAGLFDTQAAGDANKAAFFQLVGFIPVLLVGYSRSKTVLFSAILLGSIISSGSNGTAIAFSIGLTIIVLLITYIKKMKSILVIFITILITVILLMWGIFTTERMNSSENLNRLESIGVGRFDTSAEGRLYLWERGLDVMVEKNTYIWGIGPENFREIDPANRNKQLHNDILAFMVERGLIALLGLGLFALISGIKSLKLIYLWSKNQNSIPFGATVFLPTLVAIIIVSLFHQIFHARELWLFLAIEDLLLFKYSTTQRHLIS